MTIISPSPEFSRAPVHFDKAAEGAGMELEDSDKKETTALQLAVLYDESPLSSIHSTSYFENTNNTTATHAAVEENDTSQSSLNSSSNESLLPTQKTKRDRFPSPSHDSTNAKVIITFLQKPSHGQFPNARFKNIITDNLFVEPEASTSFAKKEESNNTEPTTSSKAKRSYTKQKLNIGRMSGNAYLVAALASH